MPKPRIAEVVRVAIAKPAASSLAEFIRRPVESRSIDFALCNSEALAAFCAINALKFVLMADTVTPQEWKLRKVISGIETNSWNRLNYLCII
jgi:hypothetical protein